MLGLTFLAGAIALLCKEEGKAPLPSKVLEASTVYLVNGTVDTKALDSAYNALKKLGKYEVVQDRGKADLLPVLTENADYICSMNTASASSDQRGTYAQRSGVSIPFKARTFFLRVFDAKTGGPLWTETRLMYWTPATTAEFLVERLRMRAAPW
jgi:hypothetical protein